MSVSTRITAEQYAAMTDRGDFLPREHHRVELIRGELVPKFGDDPGTPMNPPHASAVRILSRWSYEVLPPEVGEVSVQCSILLAGLDSVPDPDITWLAPKDYARALPTPDDVLLLIEVADWSLAKDRGLKLELYAEAGVRDYWIANVRERCVEVYRDPLGTAYRDVSTYRAGQEVRPLAFPEIALPVSRIFPD